MTDRFSFGLQVKYVTQDFGTYPNWISFGGTEWYAERVREGRWGRLLWIEQSLGDVRISTRTLRKSPGFSLAVIGTLALCIGANASVLSALHGLILRKGTISKYLR